MSLQVDRLRILREQHGWSQRELARRCKLSEPQIHKYETGQSDPSANNLNSIADQLGVSTDYLLGRTDDPRGHFGDGQISDDERSMLEAYRREGWSGVARLSVEKITK